MTHVKKRPMRTPPVLTLEEVAACCGVTVSTVRRWISQDEHPLPSRMLSRLRRVVFPRELEAWAAACSMVLLADPNDVAQPWPRSAA